MTLELFARNLRYLRKQKKLSQKGLSKEIFATRSLIQAIERGRTTPSLDFAIRVCGYFHTDLNTITLVELEKKIA